MAFAYWKSQKIEPAIKAIKDKKFQNSRREIIVKSFTIKLLKRTMEDLFWIYNMVNFQNSHSLQYEVSKNHHYLILLGNDDWNTNITPTASPQFMVEVRAVILTWHNAMKNRFNLFNEQFRQKWLSLGSKTMKWQTNHSTDFLWKFLFGEKSFESFPQF